MKRQDGGSAVPLPRPVNVAEGVSHTSGPSCQQYLRHPRLVYSVNLMQQHCLVSWKVNNKQYTRLVRYMKLLEKKGKLPGARKGLSWGKKNK